MFACFIAGTCINNATAQTNIVGITRKDLLEAASLHAILMTHDPWGTFNLQVIRTTKDLANMAQKVAGDVK